MGERYTKADDLGKSWSSAALALLSLLEAWHLVEMLMGQEQGA